MVPAARAHIHPHEHAGGHLWVVLEAGGTYLGGEERIALAPGTIPVAPAGESHGVENTGQEGLVVTRVSAGCFLTKAA